jgi:methyl-accepting chemotaxis protein
MSKAADVMRRGAGTTARALLEQAAAGEHISRSADNLRTMSGAVARSMAEQTRNMREIAGASDTVRSQAEQTARAVKEQAASLKSMTSGAQNTLKQMKLISHANKEHSVVAAALLASLNDVRQITDRNAAGVKRTRGGTDDLLRRANALVALVEGPRRVSRRRTNGRT